MFAEALYFLWSQLAPAMAALAGNCSYFVSTANNFSGNHADLAGAVIYSSNISSMQLLCSADLDTQDPSADCPQWDTTSFPANTVGAQGIVGYGPGLAFPPAAVTFSGSVNNTKQISYISDGSTRVPVPIVNVLDQAGNKVRAQPLIVNVTVNPVSATTNGMSLPQLPGQTEAAGDVNGDIAICKVLLSWYQTGCITCCSTHSTKGVLIASQHNCDGHCMPRHHSEAEVDTGTAATTDTCHHLSTDNAGGYAQLLWSRAMSGSPRAQLTGPSRSGILRQDS